MDMDINWKIVGIAGCALFISGVFIGFLGAGGQPLPVSSRLPAFVGEVLGQFVLYALIFSWVGYRQGHRPILHAVLAYLLASALAVSILALLEFVLTLPPTEPRPLALHAMDWIVAVVSAGLGLVVGRIFSSRALQSQARHDA